MFQGGSWERGMRGRKRRRVKGGVLVCNDHQLVGGTRGRQCWMLNQKGSNSVDVRSSKLMFSIRLFFWRQGLVNDCYIQEAQGEKDARTWNVGSGESLELL